MNQRHRDPRQGPGELLRPEDLAVSPRAAPRIVVRRKSRGESAVRLRRNAQVELAMLSNLSNSRGGGLGAARAIFAVHLKAFLAEKAQEWQRDR
jgi:hypothetical protein